MRFMHGMWDVPNSPEFSGFEAFSSQEAA